MSTETKERTAPAPEVTGDKLRHLYCARPHGAAADAIARCGAKRNTPHTGFSLISEIQTGEFCLMCVEAVTDSGGHGLCDECRGVKS